MAKIKRSDIVGVHVEEESPHLNSPVLFQQSDIRVVDVNLSHYNWNNVAQNVDCDVPCQEIADTNIVHFFSSVFSFHCFCVVAFLAIESGKTNKCWYKCWEEDNPESNGHSNVSLLGELEPVECSYSPVIWVSCSHHSHDLGNDSAVPTPK